MAACHHIGCQKEGTVALKIIVPSASGMRLTAAEGLLGVILCESHFEDAELVPEFVNHPAIQRLFAQVMDDAAAPVWDDAYLDAVPLDSPEFKAWKSMEARVN